MDGFSWGTLLATLAAFGAMSPLFIYLISAVKKAAVTEEKVSQLEAEDETIHKRIDTYKADDKHTHTKLEDKIDGLSERINDLPEKIVDKIVALQK